MKSRDKRLSAAGIIAAGALVALWRWHPAERPTLPQPAHPAARLRPGVDALPVSATVPVSLPAKPQPAAPPPRDPRRALLRTSRNYAQLVHDLVPAAGAGDSTAGYLLANALRYCDEHLKILRRPDGSIRSFSALQARWANRPAGFQQQWNDAYERCRDFLDNPADLPPTSSWPAWLDRADAAGFPPAQSEKADDIRMADLLKDAADAGAGDVVPQTSGPARDHALAAATSGDPDSLFRTADWVDGTTHSPEDYVDLTSAWRLLACRRGYDDCGASSEWIRTMCLFDAACVDVNDANDYFRMHLGSHFDAVQQLAERIGAAVDAKDLNAIAAFL